MIVALQKVYDKWIKENYINFMDGTWQEQQIPPKYRYKAASSGYGTPRSITLTSSGKKLVDDIFFGI